MDKGGQAGARRYNSSVQRPAYSQSVQQQKYNWANNQTNKHSACAASIDKTLQLTPVWTSGLTQVEETKKERVQKDAVAIMLDEKYESYAKALTEWHWFKLNKPSEQISKTRSVDNNLLLPVQGRTK